MTSDQEPYQDLPQALIERLKVADESQPTITSRVDREILGSAQSQFAARPARRRRSYAWAAVAAALLLALLLVELRDPEPEQAPPVYADLDQSGSIDIADVLVLAQSAKAGGVSQADIDAFAQRVVSLSPTGETS